MSLQIGRVRLGEADLRPFEEEASDDGRSVTLKGIVHTNVQGASVAGLAAIHDDILGLPTSLVAGVFDTKNHRNGYYTVDSTKSSLIHLPAAQVVRIEWEIALVREGSVSEIDLETRLSGPLSRVNDYAQVGTRWTAPPIGHRAFWAGSTLPSVITRSAADGAISVYSGMPVVLPAVRWACDPLLYKGGRVKLTDATGERAGAGIILSPEWQIDNGLISLSMSAGKLMLSSYKNGGWSGQELALTTNASDLGTPSLVSVLNNQPERITLRLVWGTATRVTADVTIRRGSRFAEAVLKSAVSGSLGVRPVVATAVTQTLGYLRATANDASGNRLVIGSSRNFSANTTTGAVTKGSAVRFDAMLGVEIGGDSSQAGDTATDLFKQYLGSPSEIVVAVRR